mmetsp:Transcript_18871/g.55812  ORF Transcript_18871/g.55812 Transcript_18871/m.55812 type:complete len:206 (-) Transcript_18871:298-915(-)
MVHPKHVAAGQAREVRHERLARGRVVPKRLLEHEALLERAVRGADAVLAEGAREGRVDEGGDRGVVHPHAPLRRRAARAPSGTLRLEPGNKLQAAAHGGSVVKLARRIVAALQECGRAAAAAAPHILTEGGSVDDRAASTHRPRKADYQQVGREQLSLPQQVERGQHPRGREVAVGPKEEDRRAGRLWHRAVGGLTRRLGLIVHV